MLLDSSFILEADFIGNPKGQRVKANFRLNFVKVDLADAVIQISPLNGMGENGFGGFTAEGKISNYKLSKNDKRKSCSLNLGFSTTLYGSVDVFFDISSNGVASTRVSYGYGTIILLDGNIVKLKESKAMQGFSR